MNVSRSVYLLALLSACSFEAKCNSGPGVVSLKDDEVKKSITDEFAKIEAPLQHVECPKNVAVAKNGTFECTITFEDSGGLSLPLTVTQTEPGRLGFEHKTIVASATVEKMARDTLKKHADHDAEVDCGVRVRLPVAGESFTCSFGYAGAPYAVEIRFKDDEGNVHSQIKAVFSAEVENRIAGLLPAGGPSAEGMRADCGARLHPLVMQSTIPCRLHFQDGSQWIASVLIQPSDDSPYSFRVANLEAAP